MGGTSVTLEAGGVRVFVKQVPVTERELLPGNVRSTANLFGLPGFYQYGLGSAGFGARRELAAHIMTTNWVLSDEHRAFALLYHWRLLPGPVATEGVFAEFGGLDGAVAHWEGSAAVRGRLQALCESPSRLVLFLEHVPQTLAAWMADQDVSAFSWADAQLADTTAFMREPQSGTPGRSATDLDGEAPGRCPARAGLRRRARAPRWNCCGRSRPERRGSSGRPAGRRGEARRRR